MLLVSNTLWDEAPNQVRADAMQQLVAMDLSGFTMGKHRIVISSTAALPEQTSNPPEQQQQQLIMHQHSQQTLLLQQLQLRASRGLSLLLAGSCCWAQLPAPQPAHRRAPVWPPRIM